MTALSIGTAIAGHWLYPRIVVTCVVFAVAFVGVTIYDWIRVKHQGLAIAFGVCFVLAASIIMGIVADIHHQPTMLKQPATVAPTAPGNMSDTEESLVANVTVSNCPSGSTCVQIDSGQNNDMCIGPKTARGPRGNAQPLACCTGFHAGSCQSGATSLEGLAIKNLTIIPNNPSAQALRIKASQHSSVTHVQANGIKVKGSKGCAPSIDSSDYSQISDIQLNNYTADCTDSVVVPSKRSHDRHWLKARQ